jgi:two-component system chemotaxis response regulator CheY
MKAEAHPNKRLLLVDDDFATRETMSMILAGDGYRVATAANGADALQHLRDSDRPSLILLDLNMPIMDGPTFCARRKDEGLSSIPVIVVSAERDIAQQAAALGADDYLEKPVDPIQLLDVVRKRCR